jgi:hypothetical protein
MTRKTRSSSRPASQVDRTQLMIFTEGKKTEINYLVHWNRLYREKAIVKIAPHEDTSPFKLVESAALQRRQDIKEAKKGRGQAFDQYWCMFDVDEHPKLPDALDMAKANDINIALSSPCLELWFLLHFDDQTAYIDRHDAQRRSESYIHCKKALTPGALELLVAGFDSAKSRAHALAKKHEGDDAPQPWNPHSEAWKLVDVIVTGKLHSF